VPNAPQTAQDFQGGNKVSVGETFHARKLNTPLDKIARKAAGRRSTSKTERKRGHYIKAQAIGSERPSDIAFDATLRAASVHQRKRKEEGKTEDGGRKTSAELAEASSSVFRPPSTPAFIVKRQDLHKKIRVKRTSNLVMFVVDASWSMAVAERMAATKGAIMSLLTDAYQRRDRVGLVVFQKSTATLILKPTSSVELAQKALVNIPVGGKTPLSAGLTLAYSVVLHEKRQHPEVLPLLIILTDGAGNVSMGSLPPNTEAYRMANMIRDEHIRSIVINMEHVAFDQGLARKLAENLDGPCLSLNELKAEALYETVKKAL